jgi:hypothetical protein
MAELLPIPGLEKTSDAFRRKLVALASALHLSADALAGVMKIESGFNPAATNPTGGATGLIQFMPSTAARLGTTTAALRQMSAEDQLDYVAAYYRPVANRIVDDGDHYMATFFPADLGKPRTTVIAKRGEKVYDQNAGLDVSKDGILTVDDVKQKLEAVTQSARARVARGAAQTIHVDEGAAPDPKDPAAGLVPPTAGSTSREAADGPLFSSPPRPRSAPPSPAREDALRRRIARYFRHHPEGLSPSQIRGWIATVRKGGTFSAEDVDLTFRLMMETGEIAIANGTYYQRAVRREVVSSEAQNPTSSLTPSPLTHSLAPEAR